MRIGDIRAGIGKLRRDLRGHNREQAAWRDIQAIRCYLGPEIAAGLDVHDAPVVAEDEAKVRARLQELAKLDPEPDGPDGVHSMASLLLGDVEAPLLP